LGKFWAGGGGGRKNSKGQRREGPKGDTSQGPPATRVAQWESRDSFSFEKIGQKARTSIFGKNEGRRGRTKEGGKRKGGGERWERERPFLTRSIKVLKRVITYG